MTRIFSRIWLIILAALIPLFAEGLADQGPRYETGHYIKVLPGTGLSCVDTPGKMQVRDDGYIEYCDGDGNVQVLCIETGSTTTTTTGAGTTTTTLLGGNRQIFAPGAAIPSTGTSSWIGAGLYTTAVMADTPWATTERDAAALSPTGGTFDRLFVDLNVAPGSGQGWTFTFRKNGANTDLECSINDAATSCSDTSSTVSVVAGDVFSLQAVPSGSPAETWAKPRYRFAPTVTDRFIIPGGSKILDLLAYTTYLNLVAGTSSSTASIGWPVPHDATVYSFYVDCDTSPGTGKSIQFLLLEDGGEQDVECTISDTSTTCSNTANEFLVDRGDLLAIKVVPSADLPQLRCAYGVILDPATTGRSWYAGHNTQQGMYEITSMYFSPMGWTKQYSEPEDPGEFQSESALLAMTIYDMTSVARITPLEDLTTTLMKNNVATSLACTIPGMEYECWASSTITVADGDDLQWKREAADGNIISGHWISLSVTVP